jgi:hypothetical protein
VRTSNAKGRRSQIASCFVGAITSFVFFSARLVEAQDKGTDSSTPEVFEAVDPYTKANPDTFERAGYVSTGPFQFAEGIQTKDVEQSLGGVHVLWVETAHFKLGSLLQSYRRGSDDLEEKKLADELHRLSKKLPRVRADVRLIDPWLRLHLYAQRLEDEYADFEKLAGVTDADFSGKSALGKAATIGSGPYLGCPMKFSVLLTERPNQIDRFASALLKSPSTKWYYSLLPGGSWFFGTSAQIVSDLGTPLDSAVHGFVAVGVAKCLVTGFRGTLLVHERPTWFQHGLALDFGRKAEPRWCAFIPRDSVGPEDKTWLWEERVNGLVTNKFVPTWDEMLGWEDSNKLEPRLQLTAWSRVEWLLETDPAGVQRYLRAISLAPPPGPNGETLPENVPARRLADIDAAFGKSPAELDEAWKKWVRRKYPKK